MITRFVFLCYDLFKQELIVIMHISEGILSTPILLSGATATAIGTIIGINKIDYDKIMPVSLLTAPLFVATLIHVPIPIIPSSVHLVLGGLMGILLGWACFPAILVGLFLQALLFQYGGLLVLGVNTLNMALPALCCYYFVRPLLKGDNKKQAIGAFLGGFCSIFLSSILIAVTLSLSDEGFLRAAQATVVVHIPLMIIEGIIAMFIVSFLSKVQSEFRVIATK